MEEQTATPAPEGEEPAKARSATTEGWQEVGEQFQALGHSLATALRMTWTDEENQRRLQALRGGVESMVENVGQAIRERAVAPATEQARETVSKAAGTAAGTARVAGERAVQEVRPHLVQALHRLNAELQTMITRMEQAEAPAPPAPAPAAPAPAAPAPEAPAPAAEPGPEAEPAPTPEPGGAEPPEPPHEKKWYEQ
jgi:2-oxoglutarate dehydrogenase E2 component (dihydrolipoamide succinyltransferase)